MTNKRLPWFHCYPDKWLTALADMKPDVQLIYVIICLRIYEKRGPIPDSNEALGRRTGYRPSHVARAIDTLCDLGKLVRTESGALMNPFAEREIRAQKANGSREIESPMANESPEITQTNQRKKSLELELELELEEERKIVEARPKRRAPRTQMPDDWRPDEKGIQYAVACGFDFYNKREMMIRACRDYHIKHGTLIAGERGLAATWRTWCDNEVRFAANRKTNGYSHREQKAQKNADIEQRLEDAIARERAGTSTPTFQALPGIHED